MRHCCFTTLALLFVVATSQAAEPAKEKSADWPIVAKDDFESDPFARWEPAEVKAWKHEKGDQGSMVFSQFKHIVVKTPVRSPFNRNVLKDVYVSDLQMDVDLQSTARDYPHRSLCLFFGYQDPAHMYYVHFGQKADEHANQLFIVNNADRLKISKTSTDGTPWNDQWHHARIIRTVDDGKISIYFDDMTTPVMTAVDKTFQWGQVGIGSFDDTGNFDNFVLRGIKVEKPSQK